MSNYNKDLMCPWCKGCIKCGHLKLCPAQFYEIGGTRKNITCLIKKVKSAK